MRTQWTGQQDALIERDTDPWIEDPSGVVITFVGPGMVGGCGDGGHVIDGVLAPMNTDEGIQRCDACDLYSGDLEAAAAIAADFGPGFTVWFHQAEEPTEKETTQ